MNDNKLRLENEGLEVVAWQSRFVEGNDWGKCTKEHHDFVKANPSEWPGYEVRQLCRHSEALAAIAVRDARIAELEEKLDAARYANNFCANVADDLRAELAAIKEQEPVGRLPACPSRAFAVANLRDLAQSLLQHDPDVGIFRDEDQALFINDLADLAESFTGDVTLYAAPVAKQVVMPDVTAAAKALCKHHSEVCNVSADDQWSVYSQDFITDAEIVLASARLNAADQEGGQDE